MKVRLCLILMFVVTANGLLCGQSVSQRIEQLKHRRATKATTVSPNSPAAKFHRPFKQEVRLENVAAKAAFIWWSKAADISLLINWNLLEQEGIDPQSKITLTLKAGVPARVVLLQLLEQTSADVPLFYEITPWFVEVMTQRQLNRKTVVVIYDVNDLLMKIPNFRNRPRMNLSTVLSSSSSGSSGSSSRSSSGNSSGGSGGGSGGRGGIFDTQNDDNDSDTQTQTRADRGEELAQLIRDTVEPDLWVANGGLHSTIRYYNGRLIVRAPRHVQDQIGLGQPSTRRVKHAVKRPAKSSITPVSKHSDVSAVQAETTRKKVSRQVEP